MDILVDSTQFSLLPKTVTTRTLQVDPGTNTMKDQKLQYEVYIRSKTEVTGGLVQGRREIISAPNKKQRRRASRLLHKLSTIPAEKMSDNQKNLFEWATMVISIAKSLATPQAPSTRANSLTTGMTQMPSATAYKRNRPEGQRTVGIVDRSHPDGSIPTGKWRLVEAKLASVLLPILRDHPGPGPCCDDAGWFQGHIKLLSCGDQRSFGLLKLAVFQVGEVWPGADIAIWDLDQLPRRPRAHVRLPIEPSDNESIMQLIRMGNPNLNTRDWKICRLEEPRGNTRSAVIVIDEKSLGPLAEAGHKIFYGFGMIPINIYKKDLRNVSTVPPAPRYGH